MELLINVDVDDLDAAIAFYERAVGLRLARRLFEETVAEMTGAPVPIYLLEKSAGSAATPSSSVRDYRPHWTPVHLDFVVPDADAAVRRAVAAGASLERDVASFPWGRLATVRDPFGHGLCFLQWIARGYGEVE